MRNLFLFIAKNHYYFLFLLLEIIAMMLLVSNNNYQNASFINSSSRLSATTYSYWSDVTDYFNLKDVNKQLAEENARLRAMMVDSVRINDTLKVKVTDTLYNQQYEYICAKVVNNSVNKIKNYLTINKGSKDGIKPEMAVITSNGIVGIVKDVSTNFSTVISFLHDEFELSAKIRKNGYTGTLYWEDGDYRYATLKDISTNVKLQKGDSIITSGYSSSFPEGIFLGTVKDFRIPEGENFYKMKIQLSVDFSKISYVYIVKNYLKEEQKALENKSGVPNEQ